MFVVVIPKEGLADIRLTASSTGHFCNEDIFWYDTCEGVNFSGMSQEHTIL